MRLDYLKYNFECDRLIELSDNKLSNDKLSNDKLSDNNWQVNYWNRSFLKWYYDQIFPLNFLGLSHRIQWKNKNAVYRLQISVLVPGISKFEKCAKYVNEMTYDVIHSTQFYVGQFPAQTIETW